MPFSVLNYMNIFFFFFLCLHVYNSIIKPKEQFDKE